MNFARIIEFFKAENIKVVRVLRPTEDKDSLDIIIEDDLSEFLVCLNAFELPIAFIYIETFEEHDFETESNIDGNDGPINLVSIDSKLKSFAKHVGESCLFELSAPIGNRMIKTIITTEWWDEFNDIKNKALQYIKEQEEKFFQRIEQEREAESEKQGRNISSLLKKLRAMSKDEKFCDFVLTNRQSQRAILIYAVELLPELSDLDEKILKDEIAKLADKIRVKKILKS
jgi:hypothetical protein